MHEVSESPGFAFTRESIALPASLSVRITSPVENELPVLDVIELNADQVPRPERSPISPSAMEERAIFVCCPDPSRVRPQLS